MKSKRSLVIRMLPVAGLLAFSAVLPVVSAVETPEYLQWLLPKPFQNNPDLNITVVTEVTKAGKQLPPVSPEHPAYFQLHNAGYKQFGDVSGGEKTLPPGQVEAILQAALKANGYQPIAKPGDPFSLVIVYSWGTHYNLFVPDFGSPFHTFEEHARNVVDRAALVGGNKLAREVNRMIQENADFPGGGLLNPFNVFRLTSYKNDALITQLANDVYYVVASAYSASSVAANQRVLLWRTRMTVGSNGVSQMQTLPVLVQSAAPYFGKETDGGEVLYKRALREGTVHIGTATVVEDAAPAGTPAKK